MKWMKCTITSIAAMVLSFISYSQNDSLMEALMTRRVLYCPDVTLNATTLLPQLHRDGQVQLIGDMLQYWERKCGENEALSTFKTLYAIEHNTFKEDLLRFHYLKQYQNTSQAPLANDIYQRFYAQVVDTGYYPFIKEWSEKLLGLKASYSITERFLLEFYAAPSDSLLEHLDENEFNGTTLQQESKSYNKFVNRGRKTFAGFTAGAWIPGGFLSVLGSHPYLGIQVIHREKKLDIYLDLTFRFVNAPNKYQVLKDDSLFTTKKYFSFFAGGGATYEVLKYNRSSIEVLGGIGYDGLSITLINYGDDDKKDLTKNIGSVNVNGGVGYRYIINGKRKTTLGFEGRYHYINYQNTGGTPLTGNVITLGLRYSFSGK